MRTFATGRCLLTAIALTVTLAPASARAAGVSPSSATTSQKAEASKLFQDGRTDYERGEYATAITKLSASLDIITSPNARLYLGRALREAGRLSEAYAELARTEADANADPSHRYTKAGETARAEKRALASSVGVVRLDVQNADDDTKITVAGKAVPKDAWSEPVVVAAGDVEVTMARPDKPVVRRSAHVEPGAEARVELDARESEPSAIATVETPKAPTDYTKLRPYAYVAGGVGAVGVLTFVIAGLAANSTYSDLQTACPNGRCPPGQADNVSSGRTQQTIANVGLVFGVLGLAAGTTLFVLSMPKKDGAPPSAAASTALRVGPAGAAVQWRF
ncbi:MAG: hypothetical protein JWM74_5800 [Myxococcaceae bacterium]|nr:hypothetical protein [Myxococcaceae bacterium]